MLRIFLLSIVTLVAGCAATTPRNAAPDIALQSLAPYGITDDLIRVWGDGANLGRGDAEKTRAAMQGWIKQLRGVRRLQARQNARASIAYLALSGGGPDGAFGAGLINGWTKRGDRPQFAVVSGVSTGAIIALFAFLGTDYDDELKEVYTSFSTDDLLTEALFDGLTGGASLTDASGYRGLIEGYVGDAEVAKLAEAYSTGRLLLIGTTNLDASRPVFWNVTAIAASGHPDAKRLIHDVIQASSAIPGAFPPVLIPVVGPDGEVFDEMHVDGGATEQVMILRPDMPARRLDEAIGIKVDRKIYVVINNKIIKPYEPVEPNVTAIAAKAASSLISGAGAGDIYKIFAVTERDGVDLRVTSIPREFNVLAEEPFDPVYMAALFELGEELGQRDDIWVDGPPGFVRGE